MSAPAASLSTMPDGRRLARPAALMSLEAALLLGVLALAVAVRLVGLADPTDVSDEGIRGIQLRLLVESDVAGGEYHLTIALERPKVGPASVRVRRDAALWTSGDEIDLGLITVAR
jgi:hypothetical protein